MTKNSKFNPMTVLVLAIAMAIATSSSAATVKKTGSFYKIKIETKSSGDTTTATVTVTGNNNYHCNMDYPWKLTIKPSDGVTIEKTKFRKADAAKFAEKAVVFKVKYKTTAAAKKVNAVISLGLCDPKQCQMKKVPLEWPAK